MKNNISKLKKNDIVEVHGDFIFDKKNYDWYITQLAKMSCRIELIFGNHDPKRLYNEPRLPRLIPQLPLYCKDNIWMSHAPIHPEDFRGRIGNIHGHLHTKILDDKRYYNICLDQIGMNYIEYDQVRSELMLLERN